MAQDKRLIGGKEEKINQFIYQRENMVKLIGNVRSRQRGKCNKTKINHRMVKYSRKRSKENHNIENNFLIIHCKAKVYAMRGE